MAFGAVALQACASAFLRPPSPYLLRASEETADSGHRKGEEQWREGKAGQDSGQGREAQGRAGKGREGQGRAGRERKGRRRRGKGRKGKERGGKGKERGGGRGRRGGGEEGGEGVKSRSNKVHLLLPGVHHPESIAGVRHTWSL